ncbi:helix-turn-helix domain-containing protein [Phytoactinopolyspora alkaliphila]|uniref:helix-turn-helix domain-containing protein n=1 Tax=Phytoactinopolyspora alkaliphila TaxID=1783498 RepID=UPI003CCE414F
MRPADWPKIHRDLSQRISELRCSRELSQEALADAAGISRRGLQNLENAETTPGIDHLILVARALDTTVIDLLKGIDGFDE